MAKAWGRAMTITVLNPVTGKPVTITLPKGDQAEAVDVVGLAFRIDVSDSGDALPGPLEGEAKRIGSLRI